ncbi:MAG: SpoIIE family protein phosphatase, partial [Candidatus Brocadiae bacterium]|nr:SpoIIE family protein phosphatase [Candidatus Brocadiia bacterium]
MKDINEVNERGFGDILDSLNSGVYVTDIERRIVFWNKTAEQITGHRAQDVVGHRCSAGILRHRDKDGRPLCSTDLCPLHRSMERGVPSDHPVLVYATSKTGENLTLSTSTAPVFGEDGQIIWGVEVFREEGQRVRDMELARIVQRQMLGGALPQDERLSFAVEYAPRELVGGDFYHVRQLSDHRFAMFLADAAGHGPSAALSSALIYSLIMECEDLLGDPAAAMAAINDRACQRATGLGFFTGVCAALDAERRTVTFCSAGHPPLLLQRAETGQAEPLALTGLPVGIQPAAAYESETLELQRGDRVLAYTDGATDIQTGGGGRLGLEGFRS